MRRSIASLVTITVLLALSWVRSPPPAPVKDLKLTVTRLKMPPQRVLGAYLGPFRMEQAWQLKSDNELFYGYSSMVPQPGGGILAFNDGGGILHFSPPGAEKQVRPKVAHVSFADKGHSKASQDVESTTHDPASGRYWVGLEGSNEIVRLDAGLKETARVAPRLMKGWGLNTGPEAMARLADGRFVTIREITRSLWEPRLHEAVLFDGDPIEHPAGHRFLFDAPDNFSVVDMALMPDGRALILMRRLLWVAPLRFAGRIVIADTAQIRPGKVWRSIQLASLASVLPVDNFEAIGVVPRPDGRIGVWVMSDDNRMRAMQRTLLWKLSADPRELPWPKP